jgi:serine/threonine protein kinase
MPRSASKGGIGADGTRFGEEQPPERDAKTPDIGAVIEGKYRLECVIGEGGMGSVWRAHHLQLDTPVAIKLLRAGPDHAVSSARLKIEARAAARLTHPAIVRVFDVDTTEANDPFIVMELLDGESLSDVLDRGPLSGVQAVQLLLPIAEALVLAHSKGIAHRRASRTGTSNRTTSSSAGPAIASSPSCSISESPSSRARPCPPAA